MVYLQVRFARETSKVQPTIEPNDQNMLFFARAPPKATEEEIKAAFAEHGEVRLCSYHCTSEGECCCPSRVLLLTTCVRSFCLR